MRRECVTKRMREHSFGDACTTPRRTHHLVERRPCERKALIWVAWRKHLRPADRALFGVRSQRFQQQRAEQGVPITATLSVANVQKHPLRVDVANLQATHLAGSQPRAVGHHHHRAILLASDDREQALDLRHAQHRGQLPHDLHAANGGHDVRAPKGHLVEEPDGRQSHVDGRGRQSTMVRHSSVGG